MANAAGAQIEILQADSRGSLMFLQQEIGNQKAGEHKKYLDPEGTIRTERPN